MFHFILLVGFLFLSMGLSKGANNTTEANTTVETTTYEPLKTDLSTLANTPTKVYTTSEATTSEPLTDGLSTPPTQPGNTTFKVNTTVGLTTSNPVVIWPIPPTPPIPNSDPGVLAMLRIAVRSTVDLSKDLPELQFLLQTITDLISPAGTNITLKSIQKVPIL